MAEHTTRDMSRWRGLRLGHFRFRPTWIPTLVALAFLVLLCSLGRWQLNRADEKASLLARSAAAQSRPVLDVQRDKAVDLTADPIAYQFRPARFTGRYRPDRQYLLDNRTQAGRAGFHVLTPMETEASRWVLVNRGWVPATPTRLPAVPIDTTPTGHVEVTGTLIAARETQFVLGATGYTGTSVNWPRIVQRVELDSIAGELGVPLYSMVLRLDPAAQGGFDRNWAPFVGIPAERHTGYAFQWFSLAVALVVIYLVVNTRRVRSPTEHEGQCPDE